MPGGPRAGRGSWAYVPQVNFFFTQFFSLQSGCRRQSLTCVFHSINFKLNPTAAMRSDVTNFKTLFEGKKQYSVPLFQRNYTWGSQNWRQL